MKSLTAIVAIGVGIPAAGLLFGAKAISESHLRDDNWRAMQTVASGVQLFASKQGRLPGSAQVLVDASILERSDDPWGRPYLLIGHDDWFGVLTFGRDGLFGGEGEDADQVLHATFGAQRNLKVLRSW